MLNVSTFFAGLFTLPASKTSSGQKPAKAATAPPNDTAIDIDASTKDMTLFLDFMCLTANYSRFIDASSVMVDLEQAQIILRLADKYDCTKMKSFLRHRLAQLAMQDPWGVLLLASDENDIEVARDAISNLTAKIIFGGGGAIGGPRDSPVWWSRLSKLRLTWQLELSRLCLPTTRWVSYDGLRTPHAPNIARASLNVALFANVSTNFDDIAQEFDPDSLEKDQS